MKSDRRVAAVTLEAPDGQRGTIIGPADKVAELVRPEAVVGPREQLLAVAIRALTAAARLTRPVLERDEQASEAEGRPVWRDSGRREPADWAEFVTQALAGAAANIGGIEAVLAGRPGSWEADSVRQLLRATVGHEEEYLLEHRTDPLVVELFVDEVLVDVGGWKPYDEAQRELGVRERAAGLSRDATAAELELMPAWPTRWTPSSEWTPEQERVADELSDLADQLEEQREADWAAYGAALADAVRAAAARRPGLTVPVEVRVDLETIRPLDGGQPLRWGLTEQLLSEAIAATPLPGEGRPPLERAQAALEERTAGGPDLRACCDHEHVDPGACPASGCDCDGSGPTVAVDEQGRSL